MLRLLTQELSVYIPFKIQVLQRHI
jgi:hypothetical protein